MPNERERQTENPHLAPAAWQNTKNGKTNWWQWIIATWNPLRLPIRFLFFYVLIIAIACTELAAMTGFFSGLLPLTCFIVCTLGLVFSIRAAFSPMLATKALALPLGLWFAIVLAFGFMVLFG